MKPWQAFLSIRKMKWWKHALLLLPLSLLAQSLSAYNKDAPNLPVEYYSVNDGLSDRMVTSILQSGQGLMWLGTPNGLNRFDGYEFIVFNNHPDNEHQLSDSNIRQLQKDKDGNIVITYQTNFALFDILNPETLELETVSLMPEFGIDGLVRNVAVNARGEILVLTISKAATNIYRYTGDNHFQKLASVAEQHREQSVAAHLLPLQDGSFLLNDSEMGMRLFSARGEMLKRFSPEDFQCPDFEGAYPGSAHFLHQDRQGRVWFSLRSFPELFTFDPRAKAFKPVPELETEGYYTMIWEDHKGNILLGQSRRPKDIFPLQHLSCIQPDGRQFNFDYLLNTSRYIVSCFSRDFFKTLFLGIDTGLKIVQNRRSQVTTYLAEGLSQDRRGAVMRGIAGDGQRFVYFAREVDHWYELDLLTGFLDTLKLIDPATGEEIDMACNRSLHLDDEGNIWGTSCPSTSSERGRLHRYQIESCELKTYDFPFKFNAMAIGRDGMIWLCPQPNEAKGMLVQFDPQNETFQPFRDKEGNNPLWNATPYYIMEARNGMLWVGTENGLYQISRENRQAKAYRATRGQQNSLASDIVYVLHEDEKGHIWAGTTNGLNILDPETGNFRHYSRKQGLASNTVCGIVPAGQGNYWISTYNGLSFFDRKRETFRNFYTVDGFSHDEFNRFSFYRDFNDRYYFGGVNGVNAFYSEDLLLDEPTPAPILTKISRYNSRLDTTLVQAGNLSSIGELVIQPTDNHFTLQFTLPNYTSPRRNQFKTWLEGYDNHWVYQGSNPSLRFNKLPPGRYTLHAIGANASGTWSRERLSLPIHIKPAFVQTIWFIMLCAAIGFAIIYIIFQIRLEQRLQMERIRTKLSSDLHDEVSGLLSGIAMQTDNLQLMVQDEKSQERLRQIGEVSRRAMSKMSDVIWSIDSRKDKVEDMLDRMREHADEILMPLDIAYQMHISKLDRQRRMPVPLRQNLYFIFKEAINNIAKHSSATRVNITLKAEGVDFIMIIKDNGGPMPAKRAAVNGRKTGQGLANLKMRAQRIQAELDIEKGEEGFTIRLKMPRFT